jgi:hypothetical protein
MKRRLANWLKPLQSAPQKARPTKNRSSGKQTEKAALPGAAFFFGADVCACPIPLMEAGYPQAIPLYAGALGPKVRYV